MSEQAAGTPSVAPGQDSLVGRWTTSLERVASRHKLLVSVVALGSVLGIAALAYWWTRAPLYNPFGTIDPWLYTALFANFDRVYEPFANTYYAARLPWIVPGRLAYDLLPADAAYWVLHGLMFVGGVAAVFYLVRRYLGLAAAFVGAAALALTPIYWNAQNWDYPDGVSLTYFLAGLCFGLPRAQGAARVASMVVAGAFFAAAVTTNPFVVLVVLTYPINYAFVQPASGLRQRLLLASKDFVALAVGALALVISLGIYARANGGPFLYFEPQLAYIRSGAGGEYKAAGYEWLRNEPKLLVPLFLLAVAVPFLALGRRLPPFRFAAGAVGGLAFLVAAIYGWEFMAGGRALEHSFYFSYFAGSIALTMAAIAALALSLVRSHWSANVGVAAVATAGAVVALGLIYKSERPEWTAAPGGRISVWIMAIAASVIILALLTFRTRVGAFACILAIGALAFASHFAINASSQTFLYGATAPPNGDLYHAALDTVNFVNESTKDDDPLPGFWYPGTNQTFISIQSMYFYAYTAIGWELPKVPAATRQRLLVSRPERIVMLCEARDCGGGAAALRRVGYPYAEERVKHISRGQVRLWAVLLRTEAPGGGAACRGNRSAIRNGDLLRAPPAAKIYAYWAGRKHWIVSLDALLAAFGPNALGFIRDVPSLRLERLPSGRNVTSAQAWVRITGSKHRPARSAC
jgi:hypothetical protein